MGSEWYKARLGDVCLKIGSGATPRGGQSVYLDSGETTLIRSQNIYNEGFRHDGLAYITDEHANQLSVVEVEPDDVLLNITGDSVARCCLVDNTILPARVNQHVSIIRPISTLLESKFLRYFLISPTMQSRMLSWAGSGGTRNALTKGMIESFEIPVPPLPEQRAIAAVLGAFDDKIELNRRMNATLEGLARALFKSWFVDFDPVRAKMEGRPTGLPAEIDALFPDGLEASALGEVPRGWGVGSIGDIAENVRRGVQPDNIAPGTPYIALEHMPRGSISLSKWGIADTLDSNKSEFKRGEILFGKLRPYFHKVGIAPVDGVCSTDILVIRPNNPSWFGVALGHISSRELIDYTTALSTGTKMPRTNWNDIARYEITIPPIELAAKYSDLMLQFVQRIQSSIEESRTLAALRDALLPQLMSGAVRVSLTEEAAADAH